MVVQDIERDDIEFISKTLGCLPIAHVDSMRPDKLGSADLVQETDVRNHSIAPLPVMQSRAYLRLDGVFPLHRRVRISHLPTLP